ncbi:MAG: DUF1992 domain-containing protein [Deltaproteobacteria bacterium]|jgi:hypothetical protein|nr:DUF1992 domain-containing protein [Deltaproteobacteria bacterium]
MDADKGLNAIALVAERKIREAVDEGCFDGLPGSGKPLVLEDLSHLPPDMRMAYTILRNSGHLEQPVEPGGAISMRDLLTPVPEEKRTYAAMQRLRLMTARARTIEAALFPERAKTDRRDIEESPYLEKVLRKL